MFKGMGLALRPYMHFITFDGVKSIMLTACRPCYTELTLLRSISVTLDWFFISSARLWSCIEQSQVWHVLPREVQSHLYGGPWAQ